MSGTGFSRFSLKALTCVCLGRVFVFCLLLGAQQGFVCRVLRLELLTVVAPVFHQVY